MHAEDEDARARIVRADAADQRQAAEAAALHREVDDHDVGVVAAVEAVAGGNIAGAEHGFYAGVLEHAPAALQHNRMIVDDEDAGHSLPLFEVGIVMRTHVPLPADDSTV